MTTTKSDVDALRAAMKSDLDAVRADVKLLEQSLKIWTGGVAVAAISALFAALHYWPPHIS
jgi:hypothetical protein